MWRTCFNSDFKALLKAGKLENVALDERTISGTLKSEGLAGLPAAAERMR